MEHVPHAQMVVFLIHKNGDVCYNHSRNHNHNLNQLHNAMIENSILQLCNHASSVEITLEHRIITSIALQINVRKMK